MHPPSFLRALTCTKASESVYPIYALSLLRIRNAARTRMRFNIIKYSILPKSVPHSHQHRAVFCSLDDLTHEVLPSRRDPNDQRS